MSIGIDPTTAQIDVTRVVTESTANAIAGLVVRVDGSQIHIAGRADSYYVKQLATQAALAVRRGRSVRNEIHVESH